MSVQLCLRENVKILKGPKMYEDTDEAILDARFLRPRSNILTNMN